MLRACALAPDAWAPALLEPAGEGFRALPLAPAPGCSLEEVAHFSRTGEGGLLLELGDVVERVRRARHDINNPLAAALVEVQLLLMDAPDEETRRACGVVQDQLRLMKEIVAKLGFPGVPRRQTADAPSDA